MSQMGAVSAAFVAALGGSLDPVVSVDVWADGQLVKTGLDVVGGSVTVTDGQAIRSQVTVQVADPDGLIRPTGDDSTISPYGPELNIRAGIRMGGTVETVSLGWFPITDVQVDQKWRVYTRVDRDVLVPSGTVSIQATDRAQWVSEARFLTRTQPANTGVLDECARLLRDVAPWIEPALTDATVPSSITYDDDRLAALVALADVLGADPVSDASGAITLVSRDWGDSVWTVDGGDAGVLVSWQRSLTRNGVYNAAVVTGADGSSGLVPRVGRATVTDGPLRYRQGFRIPYFQSSPILTTQTQVDSAAATVLARVTSGRTQTVSVECSPNPAITAGDVVTLQAPRGTVPVRIQQITYPLTVGRMQLTCTADPVLLGQVA